MVIPETLFTGIKQAEDGYTYYYVNSDNEVIITAVSSVNALISVSPKIMKTREDIVAIAIRMWNPAKEMRRILALSFSPAALDTSTETLAAKL